MKVLIAILLALLFPSAVAAADPRVTVDAAASLTQVFPRIDPSARYSFAGSDQLAVQIQQGAPVDVYAAASPKYPEQLHAQGLVDEPVVFATNTVVLIVPRSNPARIRSVSDLQRAGIKLVVGDPTVPIGAYTRQVLKSLGLNVQPVSRETDVKGIVVKVALGEADAGFVYATDVKPVGTKVLTIRLPAAAQPTVQYELAVVKATRHRAAAEAFVRMVLSPAGRAALRRAGFGLP